MLKQKGFSKVVLITAFIWVEVFNQLLAQTDWTKYAGNPVLEHHSVYPEWDCFAVGDPTVIFENDTLKMWYTGAGFLGTDTIVASCRIGYAFSADEGINWVPYANNPVLDVGDTTDWDHMSIETAYVMRDGDTLKMWYMGYNSQTNIDSVNGSIGYATSLDGIHWIKHDSNPVFLEGDEPWGNWIYYAFESPSVLKENGIYKMWFGTGIADSLWDNDQIAIAYATSPDGIHWSFDTLNNPVFFRDTSAVWDSGGVEDPEVIKHRNEYLMYYTGTDAVTEWFIPGTHFQTGLAYSTDGIQWLRDTVHNPVLQVGSTGEWDRYQSADVAVVTVYDTLRMLYTGIDTGTIDSTTWPDYYYDIGYAWSLIAGISEIQQSKVNIQEFILYAHPNPFREKVNIVLSAEGKEKTALGTMPFAPCVKIYDAAGCLIKDFSWLTHCTQRPTHISWDGKNDAGEKASCGIYFLQCYAGDYRKTKKLILLKKKIWH